jgi:hypothetical protein
VDRDDARSLALPLALLGLGVASAAFDLGCVLIKTPFLRPGVTLGDAIEAVGVYVVLALFARTRRLAGGIAPLAGLAAVTYAFGHGIHVAANSIHDLADRSGAGDPTGLLDFWDERAGHYLVEGGRILFAASVLAAPRRAADSWSPRGGTPALVTALGGAAFGFITFASAVEGQTVPLVLPFYAFLTAYAAASARGVGAARGGTWVRLFFVAAAVTALLFFAIWGVWQHGFPEFTRVGIIHGAGGPHR